MHSTTVNPDLSPYSLMATWHEGATALFALLSHDWCPSPLATPPMPPPQSPSLTTQLP